MNKTQNTDNRTEMAPVANYTDKRGNVVPAGTVGTLSYTGGSRGWSFYTATHSWSIKASDLFKFVKASELAGATVGNDLTTGEQALNWNRSRGYVVEVEPCEGCGSPTTTGTCCEGRRA